MVSILLEGKVPVGDEAKGGSSAEERNADLIVMDSHGRTGIGRLLLGSVAERVIGRAACPVLVVKA